VAAGVKAPMLLLLPAACATPAAPGAPHGSYHAIGNEPFWSVELAHGRIAYDPANGRGFSIAAPRPRTTPNGYRYETRRLTVEITRGECSDGMSDRRYADTVTVTVGGETLRGCGGALVPPYRLAGTSWAIVDIAGRDVHGGRYYLHLGEGRFSGRAGCNRLAGAYSLDGETLTFGPIARTRMTCPEPLMSHERSALQVLGGPVRIRFPDRDTLVLTGSGGRLRLRRAI
jgi:heat shock protein HslJ